MKKDQRGFETHVTSLRLTVDDLCACALQSEHNAEAYGGALSISRNFPETAPSCLKMTFLFELSVYLSKLGQSKRIVWIIWIMMQPLKNL